MLEFPRLLARPPSGTGGPSLVGLSVSHPISETWPLFGILQQEGKTQGLSVSKNSLGGLKQLFSVCRRGTSLSWCPALPCSPPWAPCSLLLLGLQMDPMVLWEGQARVVLACPSRYPRLGRGHRKPRIPEEQSPWGGGLSAEVTVCARSLHPGAEPATVARLTGPLPWCHWKRCGRRKGWWRGDDAGKGGRQANLFYQKLHILGEHISVFWQAAPLL